MITFIWRLISAMFFLVVFIPVNFLIHLLEGVLLELAKLTHYYWYMDVEGKNERFEKIYNKLVLWHPVILQVPKRTCYNVIEFCEIFGRPIFPIIHAVQSTITTIKNIQI